MSLKEKLDWRPVGYSRHEEIRHKITTILTTDPVLMIFDPSRETELHTDASSDRNGATLLQIHENIRRVIAYFSKCTYSYELETLATMVNAIKLFGAVFARAEIFLSYGLQLLKSISHRNRTNASSS